MNLRRALVVFACAAALASCENDAQSTASGADATASGDDTGTDSAVDAGADAAADAAIDGTGGTDSAGAQDADTTPADPDAAVNPDVAGTPDVAVNPDGTADPDVAADPDTAADAVADAAPGDAQADATTQGDAAQGDVNAGDVNAGDASAGDATPDAAAATEVDLYDPDYLPKVDLVVGPDAMAILMDNTDATKQTWVHASFTCEGQTLADVGLRRKGESTYRVIPQKAAFKIKFNKWVKGQEFKGLKEMTLNNMVDDATALRERLAYWYYGKMGLPASKCNTALVTLNGENYGPYANVETPDAQFVKSRFGSNAGTFYEVQWGSEWLPGSEDGFQVDIGDPAMPDLLALFDAMEAAVDATILVGMAKFVDWEAFFQFCATEALLAEHDNYAFGVWGSHNHFLAGGADGLFRLVPWSVDLSLSDDDGGVDASEPRPADPTEGGNTLLMRCKQSPECWAAYKAHVATGIQVWQTVDLAALAVKWHAQIDPYQSTDPKRESSLDYYNASTLKLYAWITARPGVVKTQLGLP